MIRLIVLDFDGTLVDAKKVIFLSIKKVLAKHGYRIGKKFEKDLGDMPLREHLISIGVKKDLKKITDEIHEEFIRNADKVKVVKGLSTLNEIKQRKIILSNNHVRYLKTVIKKKDLPFHDVYSSERYGSKVKAFKDLIKKKGIRAKEVIYVGDKNIDSEVARKVGCISVVVSGKSSWSPRNEILTAEPDFVIEKISDLKKIVDSVDTS